MVACHRRYKWFNCKVLNNERSGPSEEGGHFRELVQGDTLFNLVDRQWTSADVTDGAMGGSGGGVSPNGGKLTNLIIY